MKKLLALFVVVLGFSAISFAQVGVTSSTATSTATATILAPLAITNDIPLNFGTAGALPGASTVVLATDDSRTTSTATLFSAGAPAKAGVFLISGTPNAAFTITLPSTITSLTGPGTAMTIDAGAAGWVSDLGLTSALTPGGTKTLKIGATLKVGAAQLAGNYSGTYDITVNYN